MSEGSFVSLCLHVPPAGGCLARLSGWTCLAWVSGTARLPLSPFVCLSLPPRRDASLGARIHVFLVFQSGSGKVHLVSLFPSFVSRCLLHGRIHLSPFVSLHFSPGRGFICLLLSPSLDVWHGSSGGCLTGWIHLRCSETRV